MMPPTNAFEYFWNRIIIDAQTITSHQIHPTPTMLNMCGTVPYSTAQYFIRACCTLRTICATMTNNDTHYVRWHGNMSECFWELLVLCLFHSDSRGPSDNSNVWKTRASSRENTTAQSTCLWLCLAVEPPRSICGIASRVLTKWPPDIIKCYD